MSKTVLFQIIQYSISTQFKRKFNCEKYFYFELFSLIKVLIQLIQFSISTYFAFTQLNVKTVPC